jgi:Cyclopropane fatty acid synthase and related methyltransferases
MTDMPQRQAIAAPARFPLWQRMMCRLADRIEVGRLALHFPGGRIHVAGGRAPGPSAELHVRTWRPLWRLMTGGDLGFARSYLDGDWDSPDIGEIISLALANEAALGSALTPSVIWGKIEYLRHRFHRNTRAGSRRNIAYHYDLGNEFYAHWLDETMTYSSALFERPEATLSEAQTAKYARVVKALGIGPNDRVLEIGCGWGGFAEYAISTTGCHVTGLTLSKEQARFARERLERKGFSDRAEIRIQDYRDCRGEFDKIVSIEMFEAVGEENWPVYFETVRERLKAGGQALIQTITIDESRFEAYRRNADFIQTFIFPGGMLPSATAFRESIAGAGLRLKDAYAFGRDYARTLLTWDQAFAANWEKIRTLGFDDRFFRMWHYYLHYCAAGFKARSIDVFQFHLAREAA